MQIIVVGCGKVGSRFAQLMAAEGHEIAVVDNDSENLKLLGPNFRGVTVLGVPIDEDVLRQAGIESADGLAAVTPDDNINMMVCQVAKEIFNVKRIFARVQDPVREEVFYQFGVYTVCPTNMTVQEFRALMLGENSSATYFIDDNGIDFEYIKVDDQNEGKHLSDFAVPKDAMIFGVVQNGVLQFNSPAIKLSFNDEIVVVRKLQR